MTFTESFKKFYRQVSKELFANKIKHEEFKKKVENWKRVNRKEYGN